MRRFWMRTPAAPVMVIPSLPSAVGLGRSSAPDPSMKDIALFDSDRFVVECRERVRWCLLRWRRTSAAAMVGWASGWPALTRIVLGVMGGGQRRGLTLGHQRHVLAHLLAAEEERGAQSHPEDGPGDSLPEGPLLYRDPGCGVPHRLVRLRRTDGHYLSHRHPGTFGADEIRALDQDHRDVVLAALLDGLTDQGSNGGGEVLRILTEDFPDIV